MELQLGLALPVVDPTRGFDLNRNGCDGEEEVFSSEPRSYIGNHKRGLEEAFGKSKNSTKELPLLLWSGQPNEEDDTNKRSSCNMINEAEGENLVVGWPPIKLWRKKHLHRRQQYGVGSDQTRGRYRMAEHRDFEIVNNPIYVKVKMEGVTIGRKINVGLYNSYQTLKTALINMFANSCDRKGGNSNGSITLTYQDKEGDWLLAGDLPWQTFLESVQCMKIIKRQDKHHQTNQNEICM